MRLPIKSTSKCTECDDFDDVRSVSRWHFTKPESDNKNPIELLLRRQWQKSSSEQHLAVTFVRWCVLRKHCDTIVQIVCSAALSGRRQVWALADQRLRCWQRTGGRHNEAIDNISRVIERINVTACEMTASVTRTTCCLSTSLRLAVKMWKK